MLKCKVPVVSYGVCRMQCDRAGSDRTRLAELQGWEWQDCTASLYVPWVRCTGAVLLAWRTVCRRDAWSSCKEASLTRAWRAGSGPASVRVQGACLHGCGSGDS
eukprot:364449-Chlamydomonas_euryale.AAC.2